MKWGDPITPENIGALPLWILLKANGFTVKLAGQNGLVVSPRKNLSPELSSAVQRNKAGLIALLEAVA